MRADMPGQHGIDHIAAHRRQLRADQGQRKAHGGAHFMGEAHMLGMAEIHGLQQTPKPVILPEHRLPPAPGTVVIESDGAGNTALHGAVLSAEPGVAAVLLPGGPPTDRDRSAPIVYADAVRLHRSGLRRHGARLPTARLE